MLYLFNKCLWIFRNKARMGIVSMYIMSMGTFRQPDWVVHPHASYNHHAP